MIFGTSEKADWNDPDFNVASDHVEAVLPMIKESERDDSKLVY